MATYVIVKALDGPNAAHCGAYRRGHIVDVCGRDVLSGRVVPPKFCQICITDEDDFEYIKSKYNAPWWGEVEGEDEPVFRSRSLFNVSEQCVQQALDAGGTLRITLGQFVSLVVDRSK